MLIFSSSTFGDKCEGSILYRPQYYQGVRDYSSFDHIAPPPQKKKKWTKNVVETGSYQRKT